MVKRDLERVIERRVMRRVKKAQKEELITPEVPNAPIPEVKVSCPGCGMDLTGAEIKCPRCGVPLVTEEELLECPECGAQMAAGATSCTSCGVGFGVPDVESAEASQIEAEAASSPDEPSAMPQDSSEAVVAEISPGAVTNLPSETMPGGRGLTNGRGAINGTGLVNGTGMINGTGLVNGTGMINGNKGDPRQSTSTRRRSRGIAKWQFLAILVALVIIIPTFIYFSYAKDSGLFTVDGDFGDWDDSNLYSISTLTSTPLTSIDGWSMGVDGTRVFFYVSASDDMMSTAAVESIFLFVDSDGDSDTGYSVEGIGADYFLEVDGWNDSIQSSSLSQYGSNGDQYDWSSWVSQGTISHRLRGHELEAGVDLHTPISASASFVLYSQDQLERCEVSNQVPLSGGVLIVTQELAPSISLSGILPQSSSAALLTLSFECEGADGVVEQVTPVYTGVSAASTSIAPFSLIAGETLHLEHIYVNASALSDGQFVSAMVTADAISSSFSKVIIKGSPARAYVGSAPSVVYIDGAFGDWYQKTASDVDAIPIVNPNIDVTEVGVFNTTSSSSFYIKVDGEMCAGAYVPALRGKPVPGSGSVVPSERRTAEDILRIYIDSDLSASTGYLMSAESKVIGADYMIELRGLFGEIISKSVYRYMSNSWSTVSATINAAIDSQRLEVGVLASVINGGEGLDFIIETTDWNHRQDIVGLDSETMLALTGGIALSAGTKSWVVQSSIGSSATAMSYQRKLFYDGTNFWSLYWDGSNTTYEYSDDGGQTWTNLGKVFTRDRINKVSLWYDDANQIVYVVGDNAIATRDIYARRGTVDPGTPSISWGTEATIADISTLAYANKNTFISKDSDGYLWVVSVSLVSTSPSNKFNARLMQSPGIDTLSGVWTARGNLIGGSLPNTDNVMATIVPCKPGFGETVWIIYTYDGIVESRTHDGTFLAASPTTIYAAGSSTENTVNAPPSAVVDSNGVVHVVFGSGDMYGGSWKGHILYTYSLAFDSWVTPITLNATSTYAHRSPTLSLDTSTGNLYAMWLEDTTNEVQIKKNISGTWTSITIPQNSYAKYYLTSIYSAPSELYICCQWTQDTSGTYEVVFEKIPEFSEVVVPVFFMMMMFIVGYRHRSRKPKDKS